MKKLFFPAMAALALGLASCSSDNVTPNGGGQPAFAEGGYAKVAIALPTQNGSNRADDGQGTFDDGLASEYKVNNATLILFQGGTEETATFHSAYTLPVSMEMDNTEQITSTTKIVSRVEDNNVLTGANLYALVVINDNGLLTVGSDNKLQLDGTNFGGGLAALKSKIITSSDGSAKEFTDKGILMLNAPLYSAQGGNVTSAPSGKVSTLVNFSNAVYKTEAEAQSKPATNIYVERAVGKVTMLGSNGHLLASDITLDGTTGAPAWTVEGWTLDVTNTKSYLVRNVDASWNTLKAEGVANYRFVGSSEVKQDKGLYRTYWAEDPNYGGTWSFNELDFHYQPNNFSAFHKLGTDEPIYCLENTFSVAHQNKQETTRAIVKVKIGNASFFTFNGDKSHLYTAETRDNRVKAAILADPTVAKWAKDNHLSINASSVVLHWATALVTTTGELELTGFEVKSGTTTTTDYTSTTWLAESGATSIKTGLGLGTILQYTDGYAYYPIRIKHFGSDLTPWNEETNAPAVKPTAGGQTNQTYPGVLAVQNNNYLGRYGVLRNNWYELQVSSITGLGDAVVPSVKGDATTDDDLYNYIAVRINILSWAKRSQNADL